MQGTEREVALIDMDCFYVQVEQRQNPDLKGKPCAVVQYNTWKGGGIIAVGYEARACGVTRNMRGDDAKMKCPDIQLAQVPVVRGKADLTKYREAGAEVIAVFNKLCSCVERASVDEAYLDLSNEVTEKIQETGDADVVPNQVLNTFVEGYNGLQGTQEWLAKLNDEEETGDKERRLAVAAALVEDMRKAVLEETGFTCSAGIAHNKMLAKLACGRNKPNKQTVLPHSSVEGMFASLPIQKVRHLGGKLGAFLVEDLSLKHMGDLLRFSQQSLHEHCGYKTGSWLYNACRGIELEPVSSRSLPKSIGCGKTFRGREMLDTKEKVKHWLSELSKEVSERLNKDKESNKRTAKSLTVYLRYQEKSSSTSASRACALVSYDSSKILSDGYALLLHFNSSPAASSSWYPPITSLGLSTGKFTESDKGENRKISNMFASIRSSQAAAVAAPKDSDSLMFSGVSKEEEFRASVKDSSTGLSSKDNAMPSYASDIDNSAVSDLSSEKKVTDAIYSESKSLKRSSGKPSIKSTEVSRLAERYSKNGGIGVKGKKRGIKAFFNHSSETDSSLYTLSSDNGKNSEIPDQKEKGQLAGERIESVCDTVEKPVGFFARKLRERSQGKSKDIGTVEISVSDDNDSSRHSWDVCDADKQNSYSKTIGASFVTSENEKSHSKTCVCESDIQKMSIQLDSNKESSLVNEKMYTVTDDIDIISNQNSYNTKECGINISTSGQSEEESKFDNKSNSVAESTCYNNASLHVEPCSSKSEATLDCDPDCHVSAECQPDDFMECEKCGEMISMWEMPEHNDFHFAKELQASLSASGQNATSGSNSNLPVNKRKSESQPSVRKPGGKKKKFVDKNVQPVTAFFSKI